MKGEQLLPEILALVGGSIVLVACLVTRKSGEYTFFATALVSIIGYVFGSIVKDILNDNKDHNP
ncbi:hypothetical protein B0S90_2470 [Caldicellulosiruptor bescii]|uniref:Uncharacterized protein n=2 Tax=Caldicellulosiruptor bescii TaxID=31899 RepID=B9MLZ7_CALBD|nr:hypothetical protein [Caldicellulosiruptor bescii]ACM61220.1 hypothetical protein Athe_2145 [Caldicellulosiruptor bescii DSM 6725]PBC88967.1 hypothetical protein B0S87_2020 [Caldicellulosiruptor bescii]PBC91551.1 hypothetical protein B0S89_1972 [Caldicellulosiruptor bescii]PBD03036.1 hypothetical protein B0S85_0598 [Caldicellulosiruptor bescii]PBD07349.1 hypothetical protein B0S90_2470 [Caldicellulosiruptor bescii]